MTQLDPQRWRLDLVIHGQSFGSVPKPPVEAPTCGELAEEFVLRVKHSWPALVESSHPRVSWRVRLLGRTGYGIVRDAAHWGGQLVFGLVVKRLRIEAGGGADGSRRSGDNFFPTFDVFRWTLLLRLCAELPSPRVDFHLCAGIEGGKLASRRVDREMFMPPGSTLNVHASPAITWWMSRSVGLWVSLSGGMYFIPTMPTLDDPSIALTPLPGFVEGGLGLEFRWGG